jgi:hypothetical protein
MVRSTLDVHCSNDRRMNNPKEGQEMMTTTSSIPEERRSLTDPERATIRTGDAERNDDSVLADAEEEEMAVLWAADTGNQGA